MAKLWDFRRVEKMCQDTNQESDIIGDKNTSVRNIEGTDYVYVRLPPGRVASSENVARSKERTKIDRFEPPDWLAPGLGRTRVWTAKMWPGLSWLDLPASLRDCRWFLHDQDSMDKEVSSILRHLYNLRHTIVGGLAPRMDELRAGAAFAFGDSSDVYVDFSTAASDEMSARKWPKEGAVRTLASSCRWMVFVMGSESVVANGGDTELGLYSALLVDQWTFNNYFYDNDSRDGPGPAVGRLGTLHKRVKAFYITQTGTRKVANLLDDRLRIAECDQIESVAWSSGVLLLDWLYLMFGTREVSDDDRTQPPAALWAAKIGSFLREMSEITVLWKGRPPALGRTNPTKDRSDYETAERQQDRPRQHDGNMNNSPDDRRRRWESSDQGRGRQGRRLDEPRKNMWNEDRGRALVEEARVQDSSNGHVRPWTSVQWRTCEEGEMIGWVAKGRFNPYPPRNCPRDTPWPGEPTAEGIPFPVSYIKTLGEQDSLVQRYASAFDEELFFGSLEPKLSCQQMCWLWNAQNHLGTTKREYLDDNDLRALGALFLQRFSEEDRLRSPPAVFIPTKLSGFDPTGFTLDNPNCTDYVVGLEGGMELDLLKEADFSVNIQNDGFSHWTVLLVDQTTCTPYYYDSMGGSGDDAIRVDFGRLIRFYKESGLDESLCWLLAKNASVVKTRGQYGDSLCGLYLIDFIRQVVREGQLFPRLEEKPREEAEQRRKETQRGKEVREGEERAAELLRTYVNMITQEFCACPTEEGKSTYLLKQT